MNKVVLFGIYLDKSNKFRIASNQLPCLDFTVKTNEGHIDKHTGKYKYDYHRCRAWGSLAIVISKFAKNNEHMNVEGKLKTDSYIIDSKKQYLTYVLVDKFEFGGAIDYERFKAVKENDEKKEKSIQQAHEDENDVISGGEDAQMDFSW